MGTGHARVCLCHTRPRRPPPPPQQRRRQMNFATLYKSKRKNRKHAFSLSYYASPLKYEYWWVGGNNEGLSKNVMTSTRSLRMERWRDIETEWNAIIDFILKLFRSSRVSVRLSSPKKWGSMLLLSQMFATWIGTIDYFFVVFSWGWSVGRLWNGIFCFKEGEGYTHKTTEHSTCVYVSN